MKRDPEDMAATANRRPREPHPLRQIWKVGDRVRFAHQHPSGPVYVVTAVSHVLDDPMVELEGMTGEFGSHIFVGA